VQIPKPGKQSNAAFVGYHGSRNRVVQTAVVNVIDPIFDNEFHEKELRLPPWAVVCPMSACGWSRVLLDSGHVFVVRC